MQGGQLNFGMGIMMSVRDLASGPIGMVARNFSSLVAAIARGSPLILAGIAAITAAITALTLGIRGLRGAWDLAIDAGEFRRNMTAVAGISRATAEEMQLLERSAIDAGIATQFSPAQATEGLQSLAAAGQNAVAATETLIPVLDLAAGSLGQLGVQQAAEAVVGTLNSYRMAAGEATNVTDRLLRITQLTNFQARDFEQGLSRAAAVAGQYGTSLNDTLISIGLMRNANINAQVASTAFREAQLRLMTDERSLQILRREGVRAYDEQTGRARSALSISMDLADALRGETEQRRNMVVEQVFGRRGILAFNAVMNAQREVVGANGREMLAGRTAIESYREEMGMATGTAAEFRDMFLSTFPGQMALIRGTVETLGIVLGDVFGEVFRPVVLGVTEALNFLIRMWSAFPRPLQVAMATIFLVVSALSAVAGGGALVVGAIVAAVAILGELLLVMWGVAVGILAAIAPVVAAITVLSGLAALVYRAYEENLGGLQDYIEGWAHRIRITWEGLTQMFTQGFLSGEVREELARTENLGLMNFIGRVADFAARAEMFWNQVVDAFHRVWQGMGPTFKVLVEALQVLFSELNRTFGSGPGGMMDTVGKMHTGQVNDMGKSFGQTLAQGLVLAAEAVILLVEAMTLLVQIYRILRPVANAAIGPFVGLYMAITLLLSGIVALVSFIRENIDLLTIAASIVPGGQVAGAATGTISAIRGNMEQRRGEVSGAAQAISAQGKAVRNRGLARDQQNIQAGTERPAAVEAGSRTQELEGLTQAISGLREASRRRRQVAEMNTDLNVDGERMARSVTRIQEREGLLEGRVVQES